MREKTIYSTTGALTMGAGLPANIQFNLVNTRYRFSVDRIFWDYVMYMQTSNQYVQPPNVTNQLIQLVMNGITPLSRPFERVAGTGAFSNGANLSIFVPGAHDFNSLEVDQVLSFTVQGTNVDVAQPVVCYYTVIAEITQVND